MAMLLEPPSKNRPVWMVATIVLPKANESGSTCAACWLDPLVYGSLLIGVAITLPAEPLATKSKPRTATSAAVVVPTPLSARSPTAARY